MLVILIGTFHCRRGAVVVVVELVKVVALVGIVVLNKRKKRPHNPIPQTIKARQSKAKRVKNASNNLRLRTFGSISLGVSNTSGFSPISVKVSECLPASGSVDCCGWVVIVF